MDRIITAALAEYSSTIQSFSFLTPLLYKLILWNAKRKLIKNLKEHINKYDVFNNAYSMGILFETNSRLIDKIYKTSTDMSYKKLEVVMDKRNTVYILATSNKQLVYTIRPNGSTMWSLFDKDSKDKLVLASTGDGRDKRIEDEITKEFIKLCVHVFEYYSKEIYY